MTPAAKKSLALAAFILMIASLVVTLVRPRIPGSNMSTAELLATAIQVVLAIVSFRIYRRTTS